MFNRSTDGIGKPPVEHRKLNLDEDHYVHTPQGLKFDMTEGDIVSTQMGTAARANGDKPRFDLMPIEQLAYLLKHEERLFELKDNTDGVLLLEVLGEFQKGQIGAEPLLLASVAYLLKHHPGKGLFHALEEVCDVWLYGLHKYAAWNWAKGAPWWIPIGCMVRHIRANELNSKGVDEDSQKSHSAHIVCNAMMLVHYEKYWNHVGPDADNRPVKFFQKPKPLE